ncbi:MAG: hypothetical protein NC123_10765 [Butyrivibrio sp.]|nr:hypothetical protein [Acetatifactor muris]MCM1560010.1 hypothetical protein [Butyrivibrio sp.]
MGEDWRRVWQLRVKKLALSYKTGWEYLPESREAGSVLTDIFLDMEMENRDRLLKIWEKQKQVFLGVVPERKEEPRRLETALWVKAAGEIHGLQLTADARVYTVTEQGTLLGFRTISPLRLTAAGLRFVIYRKGLWAWLCYQEGDAFPVRLSPSPDRVLSRPVFQWRFRGLLDGHDSFMFEMEFKEEAPPLAELPGSWTIGDGRSSYAVNRQQSAAGIFLTGECPEFAGNLEGGVYELRLEPDPEELLPERWLKALSGEITLKEEAASPEPELCLTDSGPVCGGRVLPFGREPETAACFYLACDRAAAGASGELTLQFAEEYETEEKCPEPESKEYRKLYRKYPWLRREEQVQEWQAEETLWEYFDGSLWRVLPGSSGWNTGCRPEEPGERRYRFPIPEDISPCSVEGEEHLYLRLRIVRTKGAYAPWYRKRIPVLRDIRLGTEPRVFRPGERELPDIREAGAEKMYLGFDREVLPENCWYTGKGRLTFETEQIKGRGERFGKKAWWVERPAKEEELTVFLPNYVVIRQDAEETKEAEPGQFPAGTYFYVETGKTGVLEAVSVADARYDRTGAPVQDEKAAAEHYFSHFGRMLTVTDLELLLQERYPFLQVKECSDCSFYPEREELEIKLTLLSQTEEEAEGRLQEVSDWLTGAVGRMGALWLQKAKVKCILKKQNGGDERDGTPEIR